MEVGTRVVETETIGEEDEGLIEVGTNKEDEDGPDIEEGKSEGGGTTRIELDGDRNEGIREEVISGGEEEMTDSLEEESKEDSD